MKIYQNSIIFSPSDLSNHISCKHLTNLNKQALLGEIDKPHTYPNRVLDMLREKGETFEKDYLKKIELEGKNVLKISKENPNAEEDTIIAMQEGKDVIYQARLVELNQWGGWADFVVKVEKPSNGLFDEMLTLCKIAASYFRFRDEARYSDYLMYSGSTTAQSRSGSVSPNSVISRSFASLSPETVFKIKNGGPGTLDFYFSNGEGGNPGYAFVMVPSHTEQSHNAHSLGYDKPGGNTKFNIRNTGTDGLPGASEYLIRIE